MEYYLQDTRSIVGNSIVWWRKNHRGYTCDIRSAHIWSEEEMLEKIKIGLRSTDVFYPKEKIDKLIQHHIDIQDIPCGDQEWPEKAHTL